jgi:hypothetical protein
VSGTPTIVHNPDPDCAGTFTRIKSQVKRQMLFQGSSSERPPIVGRRPQQKLSPGHEGNRQLMVRNRVNARMSQSMVSVEQDRHHIGVEKQRIHPRSAWAGGPWLRRARIISIKVSTSAGSPSSPGPKSRTGGFSPGMNRFASGRLLGLTTLATTPFYVRRRQEVHPARRTGKCGAGPLMATISSLRPRLLLALSGAGGRDLPRDRRPRGVRNYSPA